MALTPDQFGKSVVKAGLASADDLKSLWSSLPPAQRPKDGGAFSSALVERGMLTPFQAKRLLAGQGESLVLGDYVLLEMIGAGGMGQVLKARHRRMKRLVAIKLLPTALHDDPATIKRFEREVEAAARLSHPNIVVAYDAGVANDQPYFVMEYVDGTDLSSHVRRNGPLAVPHAIGCILQAARGLEFAHQQGVIHRDIKPANLLLDSKGTVKILDMGLARLDSSAEHEQLTGTGQIMGTIDYMAPEQALDTKHADARADIYSLGVTLWYLITGRQLYPEETVVKKLLAHQNNPIPSLRDACPGSTAELEAVFAKMIAKKPNARYQSVTEAITALERCLGNSASSQGVTSHPGGDSGAKEVRSGLEAFSGSMLATQIAPNQVDSLADQQVAPTISLHNALQTTEPVSAHSIQIALRTTKKRTAEKQPPWWRKPLALALGGLGGCLLIALGIWVIIRDKDGNEVARVKVPKGGRAEVIAEDEPDQGANKKTGWHGWPAEAPKPAIAPFDAEQAKKYQREWAEYLGVPVEYENSLKMKFVLIPPSEFTMGSTAAEVEEALKVAGEDKQWQECIQSEAPQHKVILTQPIYLGIHEVTQQQYEKVMGRNPSNFAKTGPEPQSVEKVAGADTSQHPVEGISWIDAVEFCANLSRKDDLKPFYFRAGDTITPLDGTGYRLPTEAEWEFSCHAGTTTRFWIGDRDEDLVRAGWFGTNSGGRTHAVGELKANPLGLFDIHGNAWEWVQDWWEPAYYGQFAEKAVIDPSGPSSAGSRRVRRGGGWDCTASGNRSSLRFASGPTYRYGNIGFRVSLTVDAVKAAIAKANAKPAGDTTFWRGWPAEAPKPAIAPFSAEQAKQHQQEWADYLGLPVDYENSLRMKFTLIPPGEFMMGSMPEEIEEALKDASDDPHRQDCIKSEAPLHRVILTQPFYLGIHEVTQGDYEQVMGKNPSYFSPQGPGKGSVAGMKTAGHPVEFVSWNDAAECCAKLSEQEKLQPFYARKDDMVTLQGGTGYRLPTEAQWEFACRAGTTTKYCIGDRDEDLVRVAWFGANSGSRTHQVGELQANPLGLYDTHGNVREWVQDWWEPAYFGQFQEKAALDPTGPATATKQRLFRGGHWPPSTTSNCRSASRNAVEPTGRGTDIGFRMALSVEAVRGATMERNSSAWQGWPAGAPKPAFAPFDAKQARKAQLRWAEHLGVPVEYENSLKMKFILIPPGEFTMGSTADERQKALRVVGELKRSQDEIASEDPPHKVILTQPFYLSVHEVTQSAYQQVVGSNPSQFAKSGSNLERAAKVAGIDTSEHPVENVSWNDAAQFCEKLSQQEKLQPFDFQATNVAAPAQGTGYRLPTEAQWEFACRAGTTSKYSLSDAKLPLAAWLATNSSQRTHGVGELKANPFGLYDMHGNISEWILDEWEPAFYSRFKESPAIDPFCTGAAGRLRGFRGGNWSHPSSNYCRSAARSANVATARGNGIGFRVALPVEAVRQSLPATTGKQALRFDDRTDSVDLSEVTYDGSHDLTLEGWFKTLEFDHCEFARFEPDGPAIFAMPKGKNGEIGAQWKDETGKDVYAVCIDKLRVGQWQHIALVYRNQGMLVFVDGQPIAESKLVIKPGAVQRLKLTNSLMELGGLRVSRKSLYSKPFKPEARFSSDADTLALFHCNSGTGDVLADSSGHNHHGKIEGAKWILWEK